MSVFASGLTAAVSSVAGKARGRLSTGRRGVLAVFAGTAIGQSLALAAAPLLSRIYSPHDLGILAIVTALASALTSLASLRLDMAVPLPESEAEARSLVATGLASSLVMAFLGTLVVAFAGAPIAELLGGPELRPWLWFVPPITSAMAAYLVLNQFAVRHRRYPAIGRRSVLSAASNVTVQLSTGALGLRPTGLLAGLAVGQATGAISLALGVRRAAGSPPDTPWTPGRMCRTLATYRRFPLLLMPAGVLNSLGLAAPVLLIAAFYGSAVAGWFGLAQRVLALPVMLIGQAFAQVYQGELARDVRTHGGRGRRLFTGSSITLAAIAAVLCLPLVGFGPQLFEVVFGSRWTPSGEYARALALCLAAQLIVSPLQRTLVVFGRYGQKLAWDASRLALVSGSVAGAAVLGASPLTTVWILSISLALCYAAGWLMGRRVVTSSPARPGEHGQERNQREEAM
ncbi:MAG TPA: oligosaccharide flippase family protein [Actinopolymorphaceae bacterium]